MIRARYYDQRKEEIGEIPWSRDFFGGRITRENGPIKIV
jgi:hypothetical protein